MAFPVPDRLKSLSHIEPVSDDGFLASFSSSTAMDFPIRSCGACVLQFPSHSRPRSLSPVKKYSPALKRLAKI
jgi:hypothetical protein